LIITSAVNQVALILSFPRHCAATFCLFVCLVRATTTTAAAATVMLFAFILSPFV